MKTNHQGEPSLELRVPHDGQETSFKESSNDLNPKMIWVTVRHCWHWALPVGAALAAVACFIVFNRFVPKYRATHLLERNSDYVVFQGAMEPKHSLRTEAQLMQSDVVLESLVADKKVQQALGFSTADQGKKQIQSNLGISSPGGGSLLAISYADDDPVTAALMCNKITDAYLDIRARFDDDRVRDLESWLAPSLEYWKGEVESHEERVRELSKQRLGFDPAEATARIENQADIFSQLRRQLADLTVEGEILAVESKRNAASIAAAEATALQPSDMPELTSMEIREFISKDAKVKELRDEIKTLDGVVKSIELRGLTALRQDYVAETNAKIDALRTELETAEEGARKRATSELSKGWVELANREKISRIAAAKIQAEEQRQRLDAKRKILEAEYAREKLRLEQKGSDSADLFFAQEDRSTAVGILTKLNERLAEIKTEQRRGSGVQSLAQAKPPTTPVEAVPVRNMMLAGAAAFCFPFLLGFLLEFRKSRITDSATLESASNTPIIGEVARLPSKANGRRKQRIFEESIDTLRANLMLSKATKGVRSITVASSMSGEGKSSVSSQLAISLAKSCGETVLLVDADLRSPDQHDIFGIDMGGGLAKVMSKESRLAEEVDTSMGDLVHVLPAGRMHMSPHRLLNADSLRELLNDALKTYSYVVVDTAPVLAAGETLGVASVTDATLICVMRDVSRTDTLLRSTRRLEAAGANLVGTVFSGVPSSQYAYRYGDYRYHQAASLVDGKA